MAKPSQTFTEWYLVNKFQRCENESDQQRLSAHAYNAGFHRAYTEQQKQIDKLRRILIQVNYHTSLVDNDFVEWPY